MHATGVQIAAAPILGGGLVKQRIKRLFSRLPDIDCVVFLNSVEPHLDMAFFYVTGLANGLFEGGGAVVTSDGGLDIVSSGLEEESAKKSKAPLHIFRKPVEAEAHFTALLAGRKKIGINAEELTHAGYQCIKRCAPYGALIDISKEVKEARAVKDSTEIASLQRACSIASEVAREIPAKVKPGMKEFELSAEMAYMLQKKGAEKPNFTIVQFGPNSAEPHYLGGDAVLKKGQFVLLDFGCVVQKYNSDITRTFVLGKASRQQHEMHAAVADAQDVAMDLIKAGRDASEVHSAVDVSIAKSGFKGRMTHWTGHSLGLATHDGMRFADYPLRLEKNMVFTVEPGIYIPGFGGVRIEDDVVVTAGRPKLLTDAPRGLIEL
jgi:Xaa-Pro dipeptidase